MSYGMQIKNDNYEYQVDGKRVNYRKVETGTWSISGDGTFQEYHFRNAVPRPPIIAVQLPTTVMVMHRYIRDSNDNYIGTYIIAPDGANFDVPYCVFEQPDLSNVSDRYGLEIYNEIGELVFHSALQGWCRIVGAYDALNPLGADCSGQSNTNESEVVHQTVQDADNNYFTCKPYTLYDTGVQYYFPVMRKVDPTTVEISLGSGVSASNENYCESTNYLKLIEISY